MAQDREAQTSLAAFYKFTTVGQSVAGLVSKTGHNDNGDFIVLAPALFRHERTAAFERSDELAVGLTTDLGMKIDPRNDKGRFLLIEFDDTEPTKRGQPKKLFRVVELTRTEIIGLRDGTFTVPDAPPRKTPEKQAANQNDLPF